MSERKRMRYLPPRKNRYPAGNPSVADPKRQLRFEGKLLRVFVVLVCVGFFVARAELKGDEALLSVERNG